jgi:toxin ParE1/3/4
LSVVRIAWTRPALADVLEIKEYIAAASPRYAQLVAERLFAAVERLEAYPLSGRMVPELRTATVREVVEPPYRIVYRIRAEVLEIIAVVHSVRRFPTDDLQAR